MEFNVKEIEKKAVSHPACSTDKDESEYQCLHDLYFGYSKEDEDAVRRFK